MQKIRPFWAAFTVVLVALSFPVAAPVYANDVPDLSRDRQRIAQALKEKNPQRAVKLIEPWLKKRSDDIELANDYALALAQMGKLDQAREVLEEVLIKNPQTSVAFQNLREILGQQAAISYAKAMGKKPPATQVALKSNSPAADAPVVLAQAEPRPGAAVEITPPPKAGSTPKMEPSKVTESKGVEKSEPKAVERPAEKAVPEPVAKNDDSALVSATQQWADAWQTKDFKRYLASYSERFQPQQFASREEWVANRKPRVTRPDPMLVKVSDIRVKFLSNNEAEVRFRQRYEAGSLKLNSVKTTVWTREAGVWKILREEGR